MRRTPSIVSFWQGGAEACIAYFERPLKSSAAAAEPAEGRVSIELGWG